MVCSLRKARMNLSQDRVIYNKGHRSGVEGLKKFMKPRHQTLQMWDTELQDLLLVLPAPGLSLNQSFLAMS